MTWLRQNWVNAAVLVIFALAAWPTTLKASQAPRSRGRHPLNAHTVQHRAVQLGVASYYGRWHRGRLTASGVPFDDRKLTAAHRTLPLGTRVRVTNLRNGRSVIVKINDRGPYVRHRLIDLSAAAARVLGFSHRGLAPVKVRVVAPPAGHPDLEEADAGQISFSGGGGS